MKYSIVIAALLGLSSAVELTKHHHHDKQVIQQSAELEYRPNPLQSPWAAKNVVDPYAKKNPIKDGFPAYFVDWDLDQYDRKPTPQFSNVWPGNDDRLMNSLIMKYAVEGNNGKGKGDGRFYMT